MPKIINLGCCGPKPYLKTINKRDFFNQNYCWVDIIKEEKRVENFRCGAAMVIKILKIHLKNILGHKKLPFKKKYEDMGCVGLMTEVMTLLTEQKSITLQ